MKKLYKIPLFIGLCSLFIFIPRQVHAQTTDDYTANITVDSSSNVLVNNQQTNEDYVANGDTVNVTFNNNAGSQILICAKDSTSQAIANGNSATVPVTVNAEAELSVNLSSGNCSNGAGNPGYLYIEGATGSMNCSVVDGKDWNVTGQYGYVPQMMYLYRGGTYVADIQASTGGGGNYYNATVNEEFSGQSSAATYYLYDGTSTSDELIGQAICPAVPVATTPPRSSTQVTTPSSNTSVASNSTTSSTPQNSTTTANTTANEVTKPAPINTPKNLSYSKTNLYIASIVSGLILFLIAVLLVLNFTNVWTKPKELLLKAWHKAKRVKRSKSLTNKPKEPKTP